MLFKIKLNFPCFQCYPQKINYLKSNLVVPKLEMWIMNHKISRPAQELLMAVAINCNTHSQQDIEVIGGFTKFRFKNKPNVNLYLAVSIYK